LKNITIKEDVLERKSTSTETKKKIILKRKSLLDYKLDDTCNNEEIDTKKTKIN
jgi:hypothetical protein